MATKGAGVAPPARGEGVTLHHRGLTSQSLAATKRKTLTPVARREGDPQFIPRRPVPAAENLASTSEYTSVLDERGGVMPGVVEERRQVCCSQFQLTPSRPIATSQQRSPAHERVNSVGEEVSQGQRANAIRAMVEMVERYREAMWVGSPIDRDSIEGLLEEAYSKTVT